MASTISTRKDDDRILAMIQMRVDGWADAEIAMRHNVRRGGVRVILNRILADDIKHSGEPEAIVRAEYWS